MTTRYVDNVWVLEVSLVHDAYGLFITQIAPIINNNERKYLRVFRWGRFRRSAQQAGDSRRVWGCSGVDSPQGAMSGPQLIGAREPLRAAAAKGIYSF